MSGHGSPNSLVRFSSTDRKVVSGFPYALRLRFVFALLVFVVANFWLLASLTSASFSQIAAQNNATAQTKASNSSKMRLRISWGGGTAQTWQGKIFVADESSTGAISTTAFSQIAPLGLGADSSASVTLVEGKLLIDHWSASNYGGVDVTLDASADTKVTIEISSIESPESKFRQTVSASQLLSDTTGGEIDALGNRCSITRVPGDAINVSIEREHLVFKPGETFRFNVTPRLTGFSTKSAHCKVRMLQANKAISRSLFNKTISFQLDENGSAGAETISLNVPDEEGVYNLEFELEPIWYQSSFNVRTNSLRRTVQFIVLTDQSQSKIAKKSKRRWRQVSSVDPVNVEQALAWSQLSRVVGMPANQTIGNQLRQPVVIDRQALMQLAPGGWQAIPLTIDRLGKPHVIELDYVADSEMAMGLSLLQPDGAGQIPLYGFDSGVFIPKSLVKDPNAGKIQRHRLTIWPKSKNPYLLVANRHATKNATVGRVRVFAGPDRLEASQIAQSPNPANRKFMAFYEAPLFPENFGAREKIDPTIKEALDDWQMFYEGANRFIEYLQANSYRGAFVTVACESSSIYPSKLLSASPKHDNGIFLSTGQDPIRKDILEMLFRMFEREGLVLVPTLAMSGPLPEVEAGRKRGESSPFDMIDLNQTLNAKVASDGLPIYNPLNRQVQRSVTRVVEELADRYKDYSAFDGIAIICRPDTYTLLPGRRWGYDSTTVQQFFQSQTELGTTPTQWGEIQSLLLGTQRKAWVDWRAKQMALWYEDMAASVRRSLPAGKLYLAPVDLYRNEETASALSPSLHGSIDFEQIMLHMGLSTRMLAGVDEAGRENGVVLLNPHRLAPDQMLSSQRVDIGVENSKQAQKFLAQSRYAGDLFTHRISWAHFAQLQAQSPFGSQRTPLMRLQQMAPAEHFNRQRFIESIKNRDARMLIDGGWMMTMGQESSILEMMTVYGNLPDEKFEDVESGDASLRSLPLAVRQHKGTDQSTFYVANASPWEVEVKLYFQVSGSAPTVESLSRHELDVQTTVSVLQTSSSKSAPAKTSNASNAETKKGGPFEIRISVPPFGLVGGRSSDQGFALNGFEFKLPENADRNLRRHVYSLQAKLLKSGTAQPMGVIENPEFVLGGQSTLSGWDAGDQPSSKIRLNSVTGAAQTFVNPAQSGNSGKDQSQTPDRISLVMTSDDQDPVWIRSNAFDAPETGRLSISVWLKTKDAAKQPPLRLAVEGQIAGQRTGSSYYRFGSVGSLSPDANSNQIGTEWKRFAVHFDDLPVEGLNNVRIGFDLMGPGNVSIDNVQVFDRWFDESDSKAITQLLASTGPLLSRPESWDRCRRLLTGYWGKFLDEYLLEEDEEVEKATVNQAPINSQLQSNTQQLVDPQSQSLFPLQPVNDPYPPRFGNGEVDNSKSGKRQPSKFRRFRNFVPQRKK